MSFTHKGARLMDYLKESAFTCSNTYHDELVCGRAARIIIKNVIEACTELDRVKKSLFYGRSFMYLMNGVKLFGGSESLTFGFPDPKTGTNVLHGIMGIATEAGELLELWQNTNSGAGFDRANLLEEIGDLFWYVALLAREYGFTFEDIERANIAKLLTRYPNAFNEHDANNRDLKAEEKTLNGFLGEK